MKSLRLFGRTSSSNTQKALWALAELRLTSRFELTLTSARLGAGSELLSAYAENKPFGLSDDFLRHAGPSSTIPVLVDEETGAVVWESNSIVRYLAEQYGPEPLYDGSARSMGACSSWMDYVLHGNDYNPCFGSTNHWLIDEIARTPADARDEGRVRKYHDDFVSMLGRFEEHLGRNGTPYLLGEHFSMADLVFGVELNRGVMCSMVAQTRGLVKLRAGALPSLLGTHGAHSGFEGGYYRRLLERSPFRVMVWANEAAHTRLVPADELRAAGDAADPYALTAVLELIAHGAGGKKPPHRDSMGVALPW